MYRWTTGSHRRMRPDDAQCAETNADETGDARFKISFGGARWHGGVMAGGDGVGGGPPSGHGMRTQVDQGKGADNSALEPRLVLGGSTVDEGFRGEELTANGEILGWCRTMSVAPDAYGGIERARYQASESEYRREPGCGRFPKASMGLVRLRGSQRLPGLERNDSRIARLARFRPTARQARDPFRLVARPDRPRRGS